LGDQIGQPEVGGVGGGEVGGVGAFVGAGVGAPGDPCAYAGTMTASTIGLVHFLGRVMAEPTTDPPTITPVLIALRRLGCSSVWSLFFPSLDCSSFDAMGHSFEFAGG
jgi:hypothetical protein